MPFGAENDLAIDRFVVEVGDEVSAAIQPYVDAIQMRNNVIFDLASARLGGVVDLAMDGKEVPTLFSHGERRNLTETRLGLLDVADVRKYEDLFRDEFYELQELGGSLTEDTDEETLASTSTLMDSKIASLNTTLSVVGGRSISGARHAAFYFTGENSVPTKAHWNPFSNFPFRGSITRVDAVPKPGKDKDSSLYACLVLESLVTSPLETVRSVGRDFNSRFPKDKGTIRQETWIPIGGVQFKFDYVRAELPEEAVA